MRNTLVHLLQAQFLAYSTPDATAIWTTVDLTSYTLQRSMWRRVINHETKLCKLFFYGNIYLAHRIQQPNLKLQIWISLNFLTDYV